MVMAKTKERILAATATIADPSRTTKVTERSRPGPHQPDGLVDGDQFSFAASFDLEPEFDLCCYLNLSCHNLLPQQRPRYVATYSWIDSI